MTTASFVVLWMQRYNISSILQQLCQYNVRTQSHTLLSSQTWCRSSLLHKAWSRCKTSADTFQKPGGRSPWHSDLRSERKSHNIITWVNASVKRWKCTWDVCAVTLDWPQFVLIMYYCSIWGTELSNYFPKNIISIYTDISVFVGSQKNPHYKYHC